MPQPPMPGSTSLPRESKGFWGQLGAKFIRIKEWGAKLPRDPEAQGELIKLVAYLMRPDLIAGDFQKRFETGGAAGDKTIRKGELSKLIRGGKEIENELDEKEKGEAEGLVEEVLIQEHIKDLMGAIDILAKVDSEKNTFGKRSLQEIFAYTGLTDADVTGDSFTGSKRIEEYMRSVMIIPPDKNILQAIRTWINNNDSSDIADALRIPLKKAAQIRARSQQFLRRARQKVDDAFKQLNGGAAGPWDNWRPVGATTKTAPPISGGPVPLPDSSPDEPDAADSTNGTIDSEQTADGSAESDETVEPTVEAEADAEGQPEPESQFSDDFKNAHKEDIAEMRAEGLKESNVDLILLNLITRIENHGVLDSVYLDGARKFLQENQPESLENFEQTVAFLEMAQNVLISGRKQIENIAENSNAEQETVDRAKRNFKKVILSVAKGVQLGHATAADAKYLLKGICIVSPHNDLGDKDIIAEYGRIREYSGYDAAMAYNCKDGRVAISWEYLTGEETNIIHSTAHEVYGHGVARAYVNKRVVAECKKNPEQRQIKISPEVEAMINFARELMANGNREGFPLTRHLEQNVIKTPDELRQEYNSLPAKQKELYPDFESFYAARELSMIDEFSAEYLSLYYECDGSPEQFVFKVLEASDPVYIERYFGVSVTQVEAYLREIDPKTGQPLRDDLETPPFAAKAGRFLEFLKTTYGFAGSLAKGSKGQIQALVEQANLAEDEQLASDDFGKDHPDTRTDVYAAAAGPFGAFLSELTGAKLMPNSTTKK